MGEQTHKAKVRIGNAEFEAEGTEASVNRQLDAFLETVKECKDALTVPADSTRPGKTAGQDRDILPESLLRVFAKDDDGVVYLRTCPEDMRPADAVLLLLFGQQQVGGAYDVPAGALKEAVRRSGLAFQRPDRAIQAHKNLVIEGGKKSGKRYALKDSGRQKARELIDAILS